MKQPIGPLRIQWWCLALCLTALSVPASDAFLLSPTRGANQPVISIQLSDGRPQDEEAPPEAPEARAENLPSDETQALLNRLPPLPKAPQQQDYNRREDSLPAPRPGKVVDAVFGEVEGPAPTANNEPPRVTHHGPVGLVETAPKITISFSQSMVPLGDLETRQALAPPVTLTPNVAGSWRWVSPRTLVFQNKTALPGATRFKVGVPGDLKDTAGRTLGTPLEFEFATPTAKPVAFYPDPNTGQPQIPLAALAFNQSIDPASVLKAITLTADGQSFDLERAPKATWEQDSRLRGFLSSHEDDQVVVFRPRRALPTDKKIEVRVGPGVPSAEGPERDKEEHNYTFKTYGLLRVVNHSASRGRKLAPHQHFRVTFNNPLVSDAVKPSWYSISPKPDKLEVFGNYRDLVFAGDFEPRAEYKVTVQTPVSDVFGQNLSKTETIVFKVGDRPTHFSWNAQPIHIPDPYADPTLRVVATNFKGFQLEVHAVDPKKDWLAFRQLNQRRYGDQKNPPLPGRELVDGRVDLEAPANEQVEQVLNLNQWLAGKKYGHLLVRLTPSETIGNAGDRRFGGPRRYQSLLSWVQISRLGVDVLAAPDQSLVWVNQLKDGTSVKGATVTALVDDKGQTRELGQTDGRGLLPLQPLHEEPRPELLLVEQGEDSALLIPGSAGYSSSWSNEDYNNRVLWHVFDDRGMYKPGETVHVKGWVRLFSEDGLSKPPRETPLTYKFKDPRGNELQSGRVNLNAAGGFDLKAALPDNMNLGGATLHLQFERSAAWKLPQHFAAHTLSFNHLFQVQEFRRPEYKVSVTVPQAVVFAGDTVSARAEAAYYAGGALAGAEVNWSVRADETNFTPPNWSQFTFGVWRPWWKIYDDGASGGAFYNHNGRTDSMGFHDLALELGEALNELPVSVSTNATVTDVNFQRWSASGNFLVHSGAAYVGLRTNRYFVEKGTPYGVEVIVADIDGKALVGQKVAVEVVRLEWQRRQRSWEEVAVDPQTFELTSAAQPFNFRFQTKEGGTYRITARVTDDKGRTSRTTMTRWVAGGRAQPVDRVEQEAVTLIPDKQEYAVGDTAKILVQAPFHPAEGTLTVHVGKVLETRRFALKEASQTLEVKITDSMLPNLYVRVDLVGKAPRVDASGLIDPKLAPRPAYATGQLNLKVPPLSRELKVTPTPDKTELSPGEETAVSVQVHNASGQPVQGAEVALFVVDEAVLALSGYQLANPIDVFYPSSQSSLRSYHNRQWVVLADADNLVAAEGEQVMELKSEKRMMMPMAAAPNMAADTEELLSMEADMAPAGSLGGGGGGEAPIVVRTNFNPLAAFFAEQQTDASGKTRVSFELPDNLTRYRVMAVAVDGDNLFGIGEAKVTARLPLMVRPSAPRFLNFGDRFELPVVLQNQTDVPMDVDLAVEAHNAVLTAGAGRRFTVPANNRVEVRFPAQTDRAGEAFFRIAVRAGELTDAAMVTVPVWTPATSEAFAVYGEIDGELNLGQALKLPANAFTEFGGVDVATTSTALHMLEDAVMYLYDYPFECAEQRASRVMSILASKDMMQAFGADLDEAALAARVEDDFKHLAGIQNGDGGFGYWYRGEKSSPYVSIHVGHAVARALRQDVPVNRTLQQRLTRYLTGLNNAKWLEKDYSERMVFTLRAYALNVRGLTGERVARDAEALLKTMPMEKAPLEALGWLLSVLPPKSQQVTAILRHFSNRAEVTAATATFAERYGEERGYLILHSSRRSDAVILESLIATQPDHPLIAKIVAGLNAHRTKGRWTNTQENLFVLFALKRYFETFEKTTPDMVARVWLNGRYQGEHAFVGRTTDRGEISVPMAALAEDGDEGRLVLQKQGAGRLYYRLGMRYAPKDLRPAAVDRGFYVSRTYEGVDDPSDVQKQDDGSWLIRRGAKVRVTVQMVAPSRRYHVALVDPMPAGFEAVNAALAGSEPVENPNKRTGGRPWAWWYRPWFQHQNLRDERAEAFAQLLHAGVHEYRYIARATTPGEFVAPPPKAEEMYSPETFGRGAGEIVVIQ
ncbi:Ig-like domain-containing alpha-2-macroglobulin family protein [Acanthopleuribacter pedis]|uniref:Alpha-2-macroglobulin n=1 Tax=Acanthopleuribacter pedis TaxID=442870 RepID=A0A8J7QEK8_9BACT|nr:Ig-like domain-containing alpha-2-macroglobulin family protein [Acanthopleuribacter pedis]MBO1316915.1 hypothetical protein [Acanthopleuribacter pedis]